MSALSQLLCDQMARHGYPPERTELRFAEPWRDFRFDLAWPSYRLAAEVNGGQWSAENGDRSRHYASGKGIERDAQKHALAVLLGWRIFQFPTDMVTTGSAALVLLAAIRDGFGWPVFDDPQLLTALGVRAEKYAIGPALTPEQFDAGMEPPRKRPRSTRTRR